MQTEKKTFQNMTLGEKIEHIWEYYKFVIFGIILGIILIIYTIVKIVTPEPDVIMNATLVNAGSYEVEGEDAFTRYLLANGYDTQEETIYVNANLYLNPEGTGQTDAASYQALIAMIMVGEIDLFIGDEGVVTMMGQNGALMSLENVLSEQELEQYQDKLYTVESAETGEKTLCGIWLPEDSKLVQDGYYSKAVLAGIPHTSKRQELVREVLLYLLEEN